MNSKVQYDFQWLDDVQLPLVNKFYRAERQRGKGRGGDRCAVLRVQSGDIVATACIRHYQGDDLLVGVMVAASYRRQGLARRLVSEMLRHQTRSLFTFSYCHLVHFYQDLGFETITSEMLPTALAGRFHSYIEQGRDIEPMRYQ